MGKRMYVGNLSYQTTENDLTNLFEQVGPVESVNIITDRDTGRSKGFGFVEMSNEDAEKAIAQFNGTEVDGRTLTVNEARPREERSGGGRGGYGGGRDRGRGGRGGYGNRYCILQKQPRRLCSPWLPRHHSRTFIVLACLLVHHVPVRIINRRDAYFIATPHAVWGLNACSPVRRKFTV